MATQRSTRDSREYPHGSGDRNTMDSSDIADTDLHQGGRQRSPATDPAPPKPQRSSRGGPG